MRHFNYDAISTAWADLVDHDESKRFVQYPWALAQLPPQVRGMRVLDIGCGEGSFTRMMARTGAVVCAYDNSIEQIRQARLEEEREPLGIKYVHADPVDIVAIILCSPFDFAIAVTVLHYATDQAQLDEFFLSTYQLLKPGGHFAALVMNPDFMRFGQVLYNRRYFREPDGSLGADFIDAAGVRCTAFYSDFSRADYEESATRTGWKDFTWCPIKVTPEGRAELGAFWDGFEEDCPYAGFRVVKPVG
ncbi:MAG: class I SAM-dependent methyltransferase [Proteobacteria bacterium]|nr:class I SAM-dependent methyltransferase [Pseudomonadota bacterium]